MSLFFVFLWVLPSVLVGVWIGHALGRQALPVNLSEPDNVERKKVLKALVSVLESAERLTSDVGTHNSELQEVGREVEGLNVAGELSDVQHTIVQKIAAVIESNHRLEDDLVCTRFQMETQAQELDRTRREARTDALSGVGNRKAFDETLQYMLSHFHRNGEKFALALLDIDYFKRINDTHGHQAGDMVVQHVASYLRSLVRDSDYVARFGGDEFAMLFARMDRDTAAMVADRIRLAMGQQNFDVGIDGEGVAITCSMGLAIVCAGDTAESITARADEALYSSKRAGRNQLQCSDDDAQATVAARTALLESSDV